MTYKVHVFRAIWRAWTDTFRFTGKMLWRQVRITIKDIHIWWLKRQISRTEKKVRML